VQCGLGRTGTFLASQQADVKGDIVTLAKSIADGVPMGACLARGEAAHTLVPGDHGSTFGGQPLACAAALAVLDVIEEEGLMENAACVGGHFLRSLEALRREHPSLIKEVRGSGLMVGVELAVPRAKDVHKGLMERGIVANAIGDTVLRFVPPLIVTEHDCDRVVAALSAALNEL
jgi:acetylornithine/N-succinyldiaminopimelate aminotransferase